MGIGGVSRVRGAPHQSLWSSYRTSQRKGSHLFGPSLPRAPTQPALLHQALGKAKGLLKIGLFVLVRGERTDLEPVLLQGEAGSLVLCFLLLQERPPVVPASRDF